VHCNINLVSWRGCDRGYLAWSCTSWNPRTGTPKVMEWRMARSMPTACGCLTKWNQAGWFGTPPPPALAADAVYELGVARHKRKHLNHIFLVPRLMTFEWRKALQKTCNYMFTIPPGSRTYWPKSEFEPLIVGLTLHFPASSPWQVKRSRRFLGMERTLRGLWKTPEGTEGALLRELGLSPTIMEAL
jgi:hypothetical protein